MEQGDGPSMWTSPRRRDLRSTMESSEQVLLERTLQAEGRL